MFCPKCGTQNVDNAQFCMKCGTRFSVGAAPGMGATPGMGAAPPNMGPAPGVQQGLGLKTNVAACLSYVFGWISGLIFYFAEKDRFIRFHALQSILVSGAISVVQIIIAIIPAPWYSALFTIKSILSWLIWIGTIVLIVVCAMRAYQNQWFKLPVAGDIAERNCNK